MLSAREMVANPQRRLPDDPLLRRAAGSRRSSADRARASRLVVDTGLTLSAGRVSQAIDDPAADEILGSGSVPLPVPSG